MPHQHSRRTRGAKKRNDPDGTTQFREGAAIVLGAVFGALAVKAVINRGPEIKNRGLPGHTIGTVSRSGRKLSRTFTRTLTGLTGRTKGPKKSKVYRVEKQRGQIKLFVPHTFTAFEGVDLEGRSVPHLTDEARAQLNDLLELYGGRGPITVRGHFGVNPNLITQVEEVSEWSFEARHPEESEALAGADVFDDDWDTNEEKHDRSRRSRRSHYTQEPSRSLSRPRTDTDEERTSRSRHRSPSADVRNASRDVRSTTPLRSSLKPTGPSGGLTPGKHSRSASQTPSVRLSSPGQLL